MACLFFQACNSADDTILSKQSTVIDRVAMNNRVINDSIAINNTVPDIVIHSKDPFLQMHQDTVFFHDKKFRNIPNRRIIRNRGSLLYQNKPSYFLVNVNQVRKAS